MEDIEPERYVQRIMAITEQVNRKSPVVSQRNVSRNYVRQREPMRFMMPLSERRLRREIKKRKMAAAKSSNSSLDNNNLGKQPNYSIQHAPVESVQENLFTSSEASNGYSSSEIEFFDLPQFGEAHGSPIIYGDDVWTVINNLPNFVNR